MHDDSTDAFAYGLKMLNIPYYHSGTYYNPYFEDRFKIEHEGKFTQLKNEYAPYECDPIKNTQCPKTECFIRGGYCHATFNENYKKEGEKNMHQTTLRKVNYIIKKQPEWHCLEEKIGRRVLESLNPFMTVKITPILEKSYYLGHTSTLWITTRNKVEPDLSWPYGNNCQGEFARSGNIIVEVPYEFYRNFRNAVESIIYDSKYDLGGWSGHKILEYEERDKYETIIQSLRYQLNSTYGIASSYHNITPDSIEEVIFNKPATIVKWKDGTKTVVRAQGKDKYDPEKGLAIAIAKKALGNKHEYYNVFKHWLKKCK